jgi:hypothetical protein
VSREKSCGTTLRVGKIHAMAADAAPTITGPPPNNLWRKRDFCLFGALNALDFAPAVVVGLYAGAVVDRLRRRAVMIASDIVRGAAVASVPIAYPWGAETRSSGCGEFVFVDEAAE